MLNRRDFVWTLSAMSQFVEFLQNLLPHFLLLFYLELFKEFLFISCFILLLLNPPSFFSSLPLTLGTRDRKLFVKIFPIS